MIFCHSMSVQNLTPFFSASHEFEYICSSQPNTGSNISGHAASGLMLLSSMHISSFVSSHDIKKNEKIKINRFMLQYT